MWPMGLNPLCKRSCLEHAGMPAFRLSVSIPELFIYVGVPELPGYRVYV